MAGVADAIERVRALHRETTISGAAWDCMEGDCDHPQCHDGGESPAVLYRVCAHELDLADQSGLLDELYPGWVIYPCATIRALGAGLTLALLNGGSSTSPDKEILR